MNGSTEMTGRVASIMRVTGPITSARSFNPQFDVVTLGSSGAAVGQYYASPPTVMQIPIQIEIRRTLSSVSHQPQNCYSQSSRQFGHQNTTPCASRLFRQYSAASTPSQTPQHPEEVHYIDPSIPSFEGPFSDPCRPYRSSGLSSIPAPLETWLSPWRRTTMSGWRS